MPFKGVWVGCEIVCVLNKRSNNLFILEISCFEETWDSSRQRSEPSLSLSGGGPIHARVPIQAHPQFS